VVWFNYTTRPPPPDYVVALQSSTDVSALPHGEVGVCLWLPR